MDKVPLHYRLALLVFFVLVTFPQLALTGIFLELGLNFFVYSALCSVALASLVTLPPFGYNPVFIVASKYIDYSRTIVEWFAKLIGAFFGAGEGTESLGGRDHGFSEADPPPMPLTSIEKRLAALESRYDGDSDKLPDDEREKVIASVKSSLARKIVGEVVKDFEEKFTSSAVKKTIIGGGVHIFNDALDRLQLELKSTSIRARNNLVFGLLCLLIAVAFLLGALFIRNPLETVRANLGEESSSTAMTLALSVELARRLSITFVTVVFAFFFLRLYSNSVHDIRYYQNEMTNLTMRKVAFAVAFTGDDEESIKELVNALAQTERNNVLSKGQTTVDLEKTKMEADVVDKLADRLSTLMKTDSPNGQVKS